MSRVLLLPLMIVLGLLKVVAIPILLTVAAFAFLPIGWAAPVMIAAFLYLRWAIWAARRTDGGLLKLIGRQALLAAELRADRKANAQGARR